MSQWLKGDRPQRNVEPRGFRVPPRPPIRKDAKKQIGEVKKDGKKQ
jgi:hypothetical protein